MGTETPDRVEVTLKFGDLKATLEGPEKFVSAEIERLARVMVGFDDRQQAGEISGTKDPGTFVSERDLIAQKSPEGHPETVAVLAFCLTQQGVSEFTAQDLWKAYLRADKRPPRSTAQAARDAKNKSGFLESGGARGTFRLSPHGERFVRFDLPKSIER